MIDYYDIDAISASRLKKFRKSEKHGLLPDHESQSLAFGTAFHMAILEPEKFKSVYQTFSNRLDLRKKSHKRLNFYALSKYKMLSQQELEAITEMQKSICKNLLAHDIIKSISPDSIEKEYYWEIEGLKYKAKIDGYSPAYNAIVDIKTTSDSTVSGFTKSCFNYGYHISAVQYYEALEKVDNLTPDYFILIAVEKEPPYITSVFCYHRESEAISGAWEERDLLIQRYKRVVIDKEEPASYFEGIEYIQYPEYLYKY